MEFGYQLSSAAPYLQTEREIQTAFSRLSEIGYKNVQLQGASYDIEDNFIRRALEDNGFSCQAFQEDFPVNQGIDVRRAVSRAKACGCRYFSFAKWPGFLTSAEEIKAYAKKITPVIECAKAEGLTMSFHPIGPDFRLVDGAPVYERLLECLPPEVQLTFCVGSSYRSGIPPYAILKKFSGRVDIVHFKEQIMQRDGSMLMKPLGEGKTDWRFLSTVCKETGVRYVYAEQEQCDRDMFDCAAVSYRTLVSVL